LNGVAQRRRRFAAIRLQRRKARVERVNLRQRPAFV
jgi:hypothetical protein